MEELRSNGRGAVEKRIRKYLFILIGVLLFPSPASGDAFGFVYHLGDSWSYNSSSARMKEFVFNDSSAPIENKKNSYSGFDEGFYNFGKDESVGLYLQASSYSSGLTGASENNPWAVYDQLSGKTSLASGASQDLRLDFLSWTTSGATVAGGMTFGFLENKIRFGGGIRQTRTAYDGISSGGPATMEFPTEWPLLYIINPYLIFTDLNGSNMHFLAESMMRTGPEIRLEYDLDFDEIFGLGGYISFFYGYGILHSRIFGLPPGYNDFSTENTIPVTFYATKAKVHESGAALETYLRARISHVFSMRFGASAQASVLRFDDVKETRASYLNGQLYDDVTGVTLYDKTFPEGEARVFLSFVYEFRTGENALPRNRSDSTTDSE